jgi:hypothetical protein
MTCTKIAPNRTLGRSSMVNNSISAAKRHTRLPHRPKWVGSRGSGTYPWNPIFLCVPSQYGFLCDSPHRQRNVKVELALRLSEPRITSGPSHLFGPFAVGRIINVPVPIASDSILAGSWAASLKPDLTCAPSQKGLSRE